MLRRQDIILLRPEERSATDENAVRKQSLRNGRGIPDRFCLVRGGETGARRWLQALGCSFAVPDSRHGRRARDRQIVAERFGAGGRNYGATYRRGPRVRAFLPDLPARGSWKADQLGDGP